MFKSWQIFAFSFIPLILVFAGVVIGSMHGVDSDKEVFPTPAPSQSGPPPTPVPGATLIEFIAQNSLFNTRSVSVPAGQPVTARLDNRDVGVIHNIAFYTSRTAFTDANKIFVSPLETGPIVANFNFTAPSTPGAYYFRCDVHPDTMNGTFQVR